MPPRRTKQSSRTPRSISDPGNRSSLLFSRRPSRNSRRSLRLAFPEDYRSFPGLTISVLKRMLLSVPYIAKLGSGVALGLSIVIVGAVTFLESRYPFTTEDLRLLVAFLANTVRYLVTH